MNKLNYNIEKGILLENSNTFIPWNIRYRDLKRYNVSIDERVDRIIYNFGNQKILSGLELNLHSMKWLWTNDKMIFGSLNCELGHDEIGKRKALEIKDHITSLIGKPSTKDEKNEYEFTYSWTFNNLIIKIIGFDMHCFRYSFKIGLLNEPNSKLSFFQRLKTNIVLLFYPNGL